jgi:hypothetical protein
MQIYFVTFPDFQTEYKTAVHVMQLFRNQRVMVSINRVGRQTNYIMKVSRHQKHSYQQYS